MTIENKSKSLQWIFLFVATFRFLFTVFSSKMPPPVQFPLCIHRDIIESLQKNKCN